MEVGHNVHVARHQPGTPITAQDTAPGGVYGRIEEAGHQLPRRRRPACRAPVLIVDAPGGRVRDQTRCCRWSA